MYIPHINLFYRNDSISYIGRRVSKEGGGAFGACAPPPFEPIAQRKNLRRLKDLLAITNELIRKFLSQQLHNTIIYIRYRSIFHFKVAQNLIAEQ